MRYLLAALFIVALAGSALAVDPQNDLKLSTPANPIQPDPSRENFYCQPPTAGYYTTNASTGFESEIVDDIPAEFNGMWVGKIVVYMGEWGDLWQDPAGIWVHLYDGTCPPPMQPYDSMYFQWGNPDMMDFVFVQDVPNAYDLEVTLYLPTMLQIQAPMSLGFVVDNTWGVDPPYCGIDYCDGVYGCGVGYYDHTYWGEPRWTASYDVAYCLDDEGVIPVENSTWSSVKSLYR